MNVAIAVLKHYLETAYLVGAGVSLVWLLFGGSCYICDLVFDEFFLMVGLPDENFDFSEGKITFHQCQ